MANPYLLPALRLGPLTVQHLVEAVSESRYDELTDPGRFTLREAVAHLADWEPILLDRIRLAAEQPGSTIVAYDETALCERGGYGSTEPRDQAQLFIARRERTIEYITSALDGRWSNEAVHQGRGPMTVADLVNLLVGHDMYHIEHLAQFLTS